MAEGRVRRCHNAVVAGRGPVLVVVLVTMLGTGLGACGGGGSVTAFCSVVKKDKTQLRNIGGSQEAVRHASAAMKELVAKSPGAIHDDVKTLSDGFDKLASGRADEVQSQAARFQTASQRFVAYVAKQCGVVLGAK